MAAALDEEDTAAEEARRLRAEHLIKQSVRLGMSCLKRGSCGYFNFEAWSLNHIW